METCDERLQEIPAPLSRKAETVRRKCHLLIEEISSEGKLADDDRRELEADEQVIQGRIDLAVKALEKNEDNEAREHISAANDFYQDSPGNPNLEFIHHLRDILFSATGEW